MLKLMSNNLNIFDNVAGSRGGLERLPLLQDCSLKPRLHEGDTITTITIMILITILMLQDNFYIIIETYHLGDRGDKENVHELEEKKLKKREVGLK